MHRIHSCRCLVFCCFMPWGKTSFCICILVFGYFCLFFVFFSFCLLYYNPLQVLIGKCRFAKSLWFSLALTPLCCRGRSDCFFRAARIGMRWELHKIITDRASTATDSKAISGWMDGLDQYLCGANKGCGGDVTWQELRGTPRERWGCWQSDTCKWGEGSVSVSVSKKHLKKYSISTL